MRTCWTLCAFGRFDLLRFFLFGVPDASIPVSVAVYSVVDGFFSAFLKCLRAVGFLWQLFFESSTWHNKTASVRLPPVARLSSNKHINEPSWKTRKNWRFERKVWNRRCYRGCNQRNEQWQNLSVSKITLAKCGAQEIDQFQLLHPLQIDQS